MTNRAEWRNVPRVQDAAGVWHIVAVVSFMQSAFHTIDHLTACGKRIPSSEIHNLGPVPSCEDCITEWMKG